MSFDSSGILYSAVAKSSVILVSSQRVDGDFETELNSFLPNIPVERNTKSGFVSGMCHLEGSNLVTDDDNWQTAVRTYKIQ